MPMRLANVQHGAVHPLHLLMRNTRRLVLQALFRSWSQAVPRSRPLHEMVRRSCFVPRLDAAEARDALLELMQPAAQEQGFDLLEAVDAACERETICPTGAPHGLALPRARLHGLRGPVVLAGISRRGIDFSAPDGQPARLLFLSVTPAGASTEHLEVLSTIVSAFPDLPSVDAAAETETFEDFVAVLRSLRR